MNVMYDNEQIKNIQNYFFRLTQPQTYTLKYFKWNKTINKSKQVSNQGIRKWSFHKHTKQSFLEKKTATNILTTMIQIKRNDIKINVSKEPINQLTAYKIIIISDKYKEITSCQEFKIMITS